MTNGANAEETRDEDDDGGISQAELDRIIRIAREERAVRRAAMTPEAREAEDAEREAESAKFAAREAADEAFWLDAAARVSPSLRAALEEQGARDPRDLSPIRRRDLGKLLSFEEQWALRVDVFLSLGLHDFFTGPGPVEVEDCRENMRVPRWTEERLGPTNVEGQKRSLDPAFCVLRDAVAAAGLSGRIRCRGSETVRAEKEPGGASTRFTSYRLVVLDAALLPRPAREAWERGERLSSLTLWGPGSPQLSRCADLWPGSMATLWDSARNFLTTDAGAEPHPLKAPLIAALRGFQSRHVCGGGTMARNWVPDDGAPVWPAWVGVRQDYARYPHGNLAYDRIPRWPELRFDGDPVERLAEGIVVPWPATGERVRLVLDRHPDLDPAQWLAHVEGARILHVVPTDDPLTPEVEPGEETFSVFGEGYSQQDDEVPVVDGVPAMVILSWSDPSDFSITISATLGADGLPAIGWIDESTT